MFKFFQKANLAYMKKGDPKDTLYSSQNDKIYDLFN